MVKKYKNLLSPIKIGNTVFRNRLTASPSKPHFLQGPDPYPTEAVISHFANKAKNGAAIVTCSGISGHFTFEEKPAKYEPARAMRGHFDSFNIYDFWFDGVYCAVTARLLAYNCRGIDTERSFVGGLLHNIGHLLIYQNMSSDARAAREQAKEKNMPLYLAEREVFGFDYAQVGAALMREWQLPMSLQEITECHVEPENSRDFRLETAIIHIASVLTQNALEDIPVTPETLAINPVAWGITGLSVDDMAEVKQEVDQQASVVMNLYSLIKEMPKFFGGLI